MPDLPKGDFTEYNITRNLNVTVTVISLFSRKVKNYDLHQYIITILLIRIFTSSSQANTGVVKKIHV